VSRVREVCERGLRARGVRQLNPSMLMELRSPGPVGGWRTRALPLADGTSGRSATFAVLFAAERPLSDTSSKLATPIAE
jgi:hypothetical protein